MSDGAVLFLAACAIAIGFYGKHDIDRKYAKAKADLDQMVYSAKADLAIRCAVIDCREIRVRMISSGNLQ
ncbi:hypothetical protein ABNQ39_00260 (plasmid) [Azospirillum sp. A26]|uniref:hypothetical protein n=1 Tax=Azospirillum sp. A26 TaxID=3160607 RepID=UPI00366F357D